MNVSRIMTVDVKTCRHDDSLDVSCGRDVETGCRLSPCGGPGDARAGYDYRS